MPGRFHLTYANVMVTVLAFIVLGGGAYAAGHLGKNSVGSRQLKKDSVTGAKVKNDSLTGADINEATVRDVRSAVFAAETNALQGLSASQIAGWTKLRCPSGTELVAGVCFDSEGQEEYKGLVEALKDCASHGRRLPSEGELIASQVDAGPAEIPGEWAEPLIDDGELKGPLVASDLPTKTVTLEFASASETHPYRCVIPPSN